MNYLEPDLAIVPRLSTISSLFMPTPESNIVIVLSLGLVMMLMYSPSPLAGALYPLIYLNLCFSRASEQLDKSSLRKTSLSV